MLQKVGVNMNRIIKIDTITKWKTYSRRISPALLAVCLAAIISGLTLFKTPIHGLADNGDFYRAMLHNGIYRLFDHPNEYVDYVVQKFGIFQYYNEHVGVVFSSHSFFIKLALGLNKLWYSQTIFDIRFLGLVYYLFYLPGLYLLTRAMVFPYRTKSSYFIAIVTVLIFADSSFILYFNSFYAEPVMFLSFIYSCAAVLTLARQVFNVKWPMIVLFFISTVILILSKQQNAPLVFSFSFIALGFLFLQQYRARKLGIYSGIMLILLSGLFMYSTINQEFKTINRYQAFTHGVLTQTKDPSKKIAEQNIDEQYALMRTQDYYTKTYAAIKPENEYVKKNLTDQLSLSWIINYYAKHSRQFLNLLDLATKNMMITQVKSVGNSVKESGEKPGKQFTFFTLFSAYMGAFFPKKYAFICLVALAFIAVYGVGFYLDVQLKKIDGILRFFLIVGLMSLCLFVPIITIIGDGDADLAKHLFLCPLSMAMAILLFISDILHQRLWRTDREGEK